MKYLEPGPMKFPMKPGKPVQYCSCGKPVKIRVKKNSVVEWQGCSRCYSLREPED